MKQVDFYSDVVECWPVTQMARVRLIRVFFHLLQVIFRYDEGTNNNEHVRYSDTVKTLTIYLLNFDCQHLLYV